MNYKVTLYTHTVDKAGARTNDDKEFIFENENLLTARREAIAKAKELIAEYSSNPDYVAPVVAAAREYKDYSAYSVDILFGDELIYGSEENEGLHTEANYFLENKYDVEVVFHEFEDDEYEVLEEDYEFMTA